MIGTTLLSTKGRGVRTSGRVLLREQGDVLIFGALFLFGVGIGASVSARLDAETTQDLLTVLGSFLSSRRDQSLSATFLSALSNNMILLLLLAGCGFCAVSAPVIFMVPCFRGLGFGMMASSMLLRYGLDAVGYLCVLVLPNLIGSTVVLLFCCRDALRLSHAFWNAMSVNPRGAQPIRAGGFGARCILYAILLAVGAAAEAYLFFFFSGIFVPV